MNLLCGHSVPFSQTWPASGSMRNGRSSERPMSALPTSVSGSSSSPGLPTPTASDGGANRGSSAGWGLRDWSRNLPTPRARDARGRGFEDALLNVVQLLPTPTVSEANGIGHAADGGMNLRHTISLLPTPRASENENRQTKRSPSQEAGTHGKCLAAEVAHLLPTPTVADSNGTRNFQTDGTPYGSGYGKTLTDATTLLPTPTATPYGNNQSPSPNAAVRPSLDSPASTLLALSGASTSPPSDGGNASSDDPPPAQPTLWDD